MVEIRFDGLGYRQILRAYDFVAPCFKEELSNRAIQSRRLEVFFSTQRLVFWLSLAPVSDRNKAKAMLTRAVSALCRRLATAIPEVWARVTGLMALLDAELLPVAAGFPSSRETRAGAKAVTIADTQHYWREMARHKVYIDNRQRDERIRQLLGEAAAAAGGEIISSPIINEAVISCEQPHVTTVDIQREYIDLPEILLQIILENNHFFAVRSDQDRLLAKAIYICAGGGKPPDLAAILRQAKSDYLQDLAQPLAQRLAALKDACYLSKLGSYYDKQQRLQKIALSLASQAEAGQDIDDLIRQSAPLTKLDVLAATVANYPEYLGHLAAEIALAAGAPPTAATAIIEHWHPSKYSRKLPHTLVGALLGVADRLDSICGQYYQSEFKLSQYRNVISWFDQTIAIIDSVPLDLSLVSLLKFSLSLYESQGLVPWRSKDLDNLLKIFGERLHLYLLDRDASEGVAQALIAPGPDNVFAVVQKAKILQDPSLAGQVNDCAEACRLLDRVSAQTDEYERAARVFFEQPAEIDLFDVYLLVQDEVKKHLQLRRLEAALAALARLRLPIQRFIDTVDLDTQDQPVRLNRLSLLAEIRQLYHSYADFGLL